MESLNVLNILNEIISSYDDHYPVELNRNEFREHMYNYGNYDEHTIDNIPRFSKLKVDLHYPFWYYENVIDKLSSNRKIPWLITPSFHNESLFESIPSLIACFNNIVRTMKFNNGFDFDEPVITIMNDGSIKFNKNYIKMIAHSITSCLTFFQNEFNTILNDKEVLQKDAACFFHSMGPLNNCKIHHNDFFKEYNNKHQSKLISSTLNEIRCRKYIHTHEHCYQFYVTTLRNTILPLLRDALVNNGGTAVAQTLSDTSREVWRHIFDVNVHATFELCRVIIPHMISQQSGSIVNIASIHARLTVGGMFPYAAAKSGVIGLTRSLALDMAQHQIRVNAVSPGWTRTWLVQEWFEKQPDPIAAEESVVGVHPLGRICEPREVAEVICFLSSPRSHAVTGAEFSVDAGLSARFAT